jgi:hypothetical protein
MFAYSVRRALASSLALFAATLAAHASAAGPILLPNQTLAGWVLSGIRLNPTRPSLECAVTPPPDTEGTPQIEVYLFDDAADDAVPYAVVRGDAVMNQDQRGWCRVDNGPQTIPDKSVKKVEIELMVKELRHTKATVIVP